MKRRKTQTTNMLNFFAPVEKRLCVQENPGKNAIDINQQENAENVEVCATTEKDTPQPSVSTPNRSDDIGLYLSCRTAVTNEMKLALLTTTWMPPPNYDWPFSVRMNKGKEEKRYLRLEHLTRYPCIVFSPEASGLLCRNCVLFARDSAGVNEQELGALVKNPLQRYYNLLGKKGSITTHIETEYHKFATEKAEAFQQNIKEPSKSVVNQVNETRRRQAEENRLRLVPIIKTIILLGQQGLALRGHRDDGPLNMGETDNVNQGNFRALLLFRVDAGDTDLKNHLLEASNNATYISKTTQNELIECCGDVILDEIVRRVREAKYFTVLADETTDNESVEQMSLCVRYVYANEIFEDFLKFIHVTDMTGSGLAKTILSQLREIGLDLSNLVGQGYDGASAMSGQFSGVQAEIRNKYPAAVYVHCASHSLNLAISSTCEVQALKNCFGVISEVATMINYSAKRVECLKRHVALLAPEEKKQKLSKLCHTRWVERHDTVINFKALYLPILECFVEMETWRDVKTSSKARTLLHALSSSEFIVSLCILEKILALTLNLSIQLQKPSIDLMECTAMIETLTDVLKDWRKKPEDVFSQLFKDAEKLATDVGCTIKQPRIVGRQRHRGNVPANGPQEHYKRNIFIPCLDNLLLQFSNRFESHSRTVYELSALMPKFVTQRNVSDINNALQFYKTFIGPKSVVDGEFDSWKKKWEKVAKKDPKLLPNNASDTLQQCSAIFFPNIRKLLLIFATLPVTTATAERSFSALNRLKNYLRTTMTNERLTGLALLHVHRDIPVDINYVIDKFVIKGNRRLDFVL